MGKVHAVLLVPAEGDPLGLLREGARVAGLKGAPGQERWELGWRVSDGQGGYMVAWDSGTFNNLHETLALVLAWDGEPVTAGMTPALAALAKATGCPHKPHLLAWANDLYRKARAWRIVAFTGDGSRGRWGHTFVGTTHQYPGTVHVPGLMAIDRHSPLAAPQALGTVIASVGLGTLILLDADSREIGGNDGTH